MLLFLLACFQIEEEEWSTWEETYSDPANTNTPPEISEATIRPDAEIYNDSTLTCEATAVDAEDGGVEVEYTWSIDGGQDMFGATLNLSQIPNVLPEQEVICVATVVDSLGAEASSEVSVTIENRNPTVDDIGMTDIEPVANASVTCEATAIDEDGDGEGIVITYSWDAGEGEIGTEAEIQLTPEIAPVDATLTCTATATDAQGGTGIADTTGTIVNTLPEITEVNITPETGVDTLSSLTCSMVGSDLNDSDLEPSFVWTNDGTQIGQEASIELNSGLALPGDSVSCTATLEDHNGGVDEFSEEVLIGNAPPVFDIPASISPNTGVMTGMELQCSAVVSDSEDINITPIYTWEVNGSSVFVGEYYTVSADDTDVGQSLDCVANAEDSHGASESSTASVVIENTAPVVNSVQLSPQNPEADDEVECVPSITDVDDESLTITYSWELNGNVVGSSSFLNLTPLSPAVGDSLLCGVYVSDESWENDYGSETQTIQNSIPEFVSGPNITPAGNVTIEELLTCSAAGFDVNDGSITATYEWFNDGVSIETGDTLQLDNSLAAPNDSIDCQASLTDATGFIVTGMVSVTVENGVPVFTSPATISPNTGVFTGTELTCSAVVSDPEDGAITPIYTWEVNGSQIWTGANYTVLAEDTDVGDSISCIATVTDFHGAMETSSTSVVVENTLPSVSSVEISPGLAYNDSTVSCSATVSDLDEILVPSYSWSSVELPLGSNSSLDLDGLGLNPGHPLRCEVSVEDSEGEIAQAFTEIILENRYPSAPQLVISGLIESSTSAASNSDLTCEGLSSSDPDGDNLTYSYSWTSDNGGLVSGITLSASETSIGDTWSCTGMATDPYGATAQAVFPVDIVNTPPVITEVSITPSVATNSDILTCVTTAFDPDETLNPDYTWMSGGAVLGNSQTLNLTNSFVSPFDAITCYVDVEDSQGATAQETDTITLENRAPFTPDVGIGYSENSGRPTTIDDLICTTSGLGDPDGDGVNYTYEWTSDAGGFFSGGTLSSDDTSVGETWTCTVTAEDPFGETAVETDEVTIENTAPVFLSINISPDPMYNDSTSTCTASVEDPDESLTPTYTWFYGSLELDTGATIDLSLHSAGFWGGSNIRCVATVVDSAGESDQVEGEVPLTNRPPSAPDVTITWDYSAGYATSPNVSNDLTCVASNSVDPDGDPLTYTYTWEADNNGAQTGETVPASMTSDGETWTCIAIVSDGTDELLNTQTAEILTRRWSRCASSQNLADGQYQFIGEDYGDQIGRITPAGDVDGDGLDDILIGTPDKYNSNASGSNQGYSGKVYLILGSSLAETSTINLANADYEFLGETGYEHFGNSISGAGDVDGDGFDDILIGANWNDNNGTQSGKAYLFLGSSLSTNTSIGSNSADYIFEGAIQYAHFGISVAGGGDVDGDGTDDILIGALKDSSSSGSDGVVYLFLGSSLNSLSSSNGVGTTTVSLSSVNHIFRGENSGDQASRVAFAGDVDNDGKDDILIGAPYYNHGNYANAGKSYLILGSSLPGISVFYLSQQADYSFFGENSGDNAGYSVSSAGDVNNDGLDDILIGAPYNNYYYSDAGKVYVILSSSFPASTSVMNVSSANYFFTGEAADDNAGASVASAGDVDGDGYDDILIGARYNDGGGADAGKGYLVLGSAMVGGSWTHSLDFANYELVGDNADDQAGTYVAGVGDVNGDGYSNILISAENFDNGGVSNSEYGKASLFVGCE